MSISINYATFNATRRSVPVIAMGAIVLAALPSTLLAQGKSAAAPKPWHLSAPQLASECRAAVADMRAAVDAAVKRPLATQTFANTLLPIEEAYGHLATRVTMLSGLLYLSPDSRDMHDQGDTVATPLTQLPYDVLCPGSAELDKLQKRFR